MNDAISTPDAALADNATAAPANPWADSVGARPDAASDPWADAVAAAPDTASDPWGAATSAGDAASASPAAGNWLDTPGSALDATAKMSGTGGADNGFALHQLWDGSLLVVAMLGIWPEAMVTLSLVLTSLVFCIVIGLPLGIFLAASDRAQRIMRPFLDAMQTTPAFVYLVPVVMLFGIGNVPGVIVTIVFALPPLVRLTNLGIRQVRPDLIEAGRAYGASPMQMLLKVQLPLAMPSVMAGINQSLMLSLSMVVIASMIAVGGLGQMVLRGIGRLDMGLATVGGLGIVLLAITLDRITQAMGQPRRGVRHWWQTGPAGLALRMLRPAPKAASPNALAASSPLSTARG